VRLLIDIEFSQQFFASVEELTADVSHIQPGVGREHEKRFFFPDMLVDGFA